jgi:molecular chaperone GrpE
MIKQDPKTEEIDEEVEEIQDPEKTDGDQDKEKEELLQKIEEFEVKYKRALADYQNLEKRVAEQRIDLIRGANKDLLLRLLPVLDTLILAEQHAADKNIEVSINHFIDILKSEGVARIKTIGEKFDPMLMEAITVAEGEDGKVVNEVRAGFLLHDKLLRAAQVIVGKADKS